MEIVQTHKFDKEASKTQKPGWWTRIKLARRIWDAVDKYSRFKSKTLLGVFHRLYVGFIN